ncbi:MAG: putative toxin-antitoxin system toxin component, PIN family [Gammaproteobacteria bacterium]|nr:putative toxin-antitoxin system toxin component, PIN family [Gammaproteobacteria bacterium]
MRIFLDTNVLASGLATRGLCTELIEGVISNHELLTCKAVLLELQRVLAQKFHIPKPMIREYLNMLRDEGHVVTADKVPRLRFKDPDDIPILACAISAKADIFVTGAKALLELRKIEGIPILSPRQLWQKLTGLA